MASEWKRETANKEKSQSGLGEKQNLYPHRNTNACMFLCFLSIHTSCTSVPSVHSFTPLPLLALSYCPSV